MKSILKIGLPAFVLGTVFGAALWYLASPLWIDVEVNEDVSEQTGDVVLATGTLRDADGAHRGKGDVTVVRRADGQTWIRFTNFEVTNGPDLEVWLSTHPDPQVSKDIRDNDWLALGQLRGNIGNQSYMLPPDANIEEWKSVAIWCQQFSVLFSPAALNPAS